MADNTYDAIVIGAQEYPGDGLLKNSQKRG